MVRPGRVKLVAANIDPHVFDTRQQIRVARQPQPDDIEDCRKALVGYPHVDMLQEHHVAEILSGTVVRVLHWTLLVTWYRRVYLPPRILSRATTLGANESEVRLLASIIKAMPGCRLPRTIVAFAMGALALASCAQNPHGSKAITDYPGQPKGAETSAGNTGEAPFSVWLQGGDRFAVTLDGSSTCPPVATEFRVTGDNRIALTVPNPNDKGQICTMDLVPHTTVFSTPKAIDRNADVSITGQGATWELHALPSR